jgi:methanogenic corrinoid protein MtbC1
MDNHPKVEEISEEFVNYLLTGRKKESSAIIFQFLNQNNSFLELYEKLIKKSLYKIGELWEYNKITVAAEHLASAIIETILNELYPKIAKTEKQNKKILLACVENEFHQIGIKIISDIFELNGWNSFFLGANTPTNELIRFAKSINPDIIGLSMSIYFHLPVLENMLLKIKDEFPEIPIIIGGQAFRYGGLEILAKFNNVFYSADSYEIYNSIKNLNL